MVDPKIAAHGASAYHREKILDSDQCGCFHCLLIFTPGEIKEWADYEGDVGNTACCPRCRIDSVIGSASGFPITRAFLFDMWKYWF